MIKNIKTLDQETIIDLLYGKAHFCSLGCVFDENIIGFWYQNTLKTRNRALSQRSSYKENRHGVL
ncbi:hypothetical protein ACFOPX_07695 [Helicobacter baculiformis]|uniref:Uncharacterized protein n=1 Tax=Helicobacter baculiformis TaxID=427351 RepID=A0ABV7ZJL5_9HELI|nr:hypothetical protein [Helicobacter baculiformis]